MTDNRDHEARLRNACSFVEDYVRFLDETFDLGLDVSKAVRPMPTKPAPGFIPYAKGGVHAEIDVPLSKFVSDHALRGAAESLPEGIREAVRSHMERTYAHHLEVAVSSDDEATAAVGEWDWDKSLPLDLLHAAGLDELVCEAESAAELDFDVETLRFTAAAFDGHAHRPEGLGLSLMANTEFEYHQSQGALYRNVGGDPGRPSVDHVILDADIAPAADASTRKFASLLDAVRQSFPTREQAPSFGP